MAEAEKSDLSGESEGGGDDAAKKPPGQILDEEIKEGMEAIKRPGGQLFMSALSGGLDVGFSLLLMAVMYTLCHDKLPEPVVRILVGNMYAAGFMFVIVGRSELFTEQTTLAVLPVLRGKATVGQLLRLWGWVYLGNMIGAALVAGLISYVGPALKAVSVESLGEIGHHMTDHPAGIIFLSAVLAGWLMGLLSWMVVAARDTISQIAIVWIVTTTIGICGLHHCVVGTVEVLGAVFTGQGVTLLDFARFLVLASLGNVVGGAVFVALIKYGHANDSGKTA